MARKMTNARGRPPLDQADRRRAVLNIRLKASEREALMAGAEAAGKSVSVWARGALLALSEKVHVRDEAEVGLAQILGDVAEERAMIQKALARAEALPTKNERERCVLCGCVIG